MRRPTGCHAPRNLKALPEPKARSGFDVRGVSANSLFHVACRQRTDSSKAEAGMREEIGYCRQKAAECAARAEDAGDKETRELFITFRNSWLNAANRYESLGLTARGKTAALQFSSLPLEFGTTEWPSRPTDALTDMPAERLGTA
jgi:hypothetical protein